MQTTHPFTQKSWKRSDLLEILETARRVGEYRFLRQISLQWLTHFPGDLPIMLLHAQALRGEGHIKQAHNKAALICNIDPEFVGAGKLVVDTSPQQKSPFLTNAQQSIIALDSQGVGDSLDPKVPFQNMNWGIHIKEARVALAAKNHQKALAAVQQAQAVNSETPLVALTHYQLLASQSDTPPQALISISQHLHDKWPDCVQFMLYLADALFAAGQNDRAVELIHHASTKDITGQVPVRILGDSHPYLSLWPKELSAPVELSLPAGVSAALGWNLLNSGPEPKNKQSHSGIDQDIDTAPEADVNPESARRVPGQHKLPESLIPFREELKEAAIRLRDRELSRSDGRFPTYVIFTTRKGLTNQFGSACVNQITSVLQNLAAARKAHPGWGALVLFADDPASASEWGIKPAQAEDAWSLKLALADLDVALGKKGAMIGALLIVGGPEIVPFHHLPNPTDDVDDTVYSDNPYATRDENFFVPEWPVGRVPGGTSDNPEPLLSALRKVTAEHQPEDSSKQSFSAKLKKWLRRFFKLQPQPSKASFGYSAEVWQRASVAVYQHIGDPQDLITSPPHKAEKNGSGPDKSAVNIQGEFGYFNLHGLVDDANWYGQRKTLTGNPGADFPIALEPQDLLPQDNFPQVVFSEACYGAQISQKDHESSIALKFLAQGCQAFVGSTVISYGSISTPLNAADLLGKSFWSALKDGFPAGEALRRAKINLAKDMHKRQGYIDGEDQKTLISFVLYGDPLAYHRKPFASRMQKSVQRMQNTPQVKTVCDRELDSEEQVPPEVMVHVKQIVSQYLPGMSGAHVTISHEHTASACTGHNSPTSQLGTKARPAAIPNRRVITLSKAGQMMSKTPQYARLTLNESGKVVKLAVSR